MSFTSHDAQNKYLYGLIEKEEVKRRRADRDSGPRRKVTYQYYVHCTNGNRYRVCKKSFCAVHAIGRKRVELLCEKIHSGALTSSDDRGKHTNRPHAIGEEIKEQIRDHIRSFPRQQSHYSRGDNYKREYLPEGLSIAAMYRLYLKKFEPQTDKKPIVMEWLYRKIFVQEFNLSFGYPRSALYMPTL